MKAILLLTIALTLVLWTTTTASTQEQCSAASYNRYPSLEHTNGEKDMVELPSYFSEQGTPVVLSFKREHGEAIEQWFDEIVERHPNPSAFHSMLVIDKVGRLIQGFILGGMASQFEKDQLSKVLFMFSDREEYADALGIDDIESEEVQIVRIYRDGRIESLVCGELTEDKFQRLLQLTS